MTVTTLRTRVLLPVLALTLVLVSACASGSSGGAGTGSGDGKTVAVTVTISKGKIAPEPGAVQAKKGDTVDLKVTSDVADEIHVHGYDIEKPLVPGQTTEVQFVATEQGRFEVETHESGKTLFQLIVR